jgi:hypothetical protein
VRNRYEKGHVDVSDVAGLIKRVEPRDTAKHVARGLNVSLRHAKRIVAGDIPRVRTAQLRAWLADRLEVRLADLVQVESELSRLRGDRR